MNWVYPRGWAAAMRPGASALKVMGKNCVFKGKAKLGSGPLLLAPIFAVWVGGIWRIFVPEFVINPIQPFHKAVEEGGRSGNKINSRSRVADSTKFPLSTIPSAKRRVPCLQFLIVFNACEAIGGRFCLLVTSLIHLIDEYFSSIFVIFKHRHFLPDAKGLIPR